MSGESVHKQAHARWNEKIALPNGQYSVHIVAGDSDYIDSVYAISANGVLVVSGTPTASRHWFENTVTVSVTNGQLTVANARRARVTTRSMRSISLRFDRRGDGSGIPGVHVEFKIE